MLNRVLSSQFILNGKQSTTRQKVQKRNLNLHEYQSKKLMDDYGLKVQKNIVGETAEEIRAGCANLNSPELVVKAQVLAGGRGVGVFSNGFKGGVHLCKTADEAAELAGNMLGNAIITKQTPPEGVVVQKVMVAEAIDLTKELYLSIVLDRESGGPVFVASPSGGVDIEDIAENSPELIFTLPVNIHEGTNKKDLEEFVAKLGITEPSVAQQAVEQMEKLYILFTKSDSLQVEVNPWAITPDGQLYCADAKIGFDDNASFRQKEIYEMADTTEDDPREVEAAKHNLNYIGLDGNIACLVNGAGLAMATMDIIKYYKGEPANFLDIGGSANEDQVREAFKILTDDPRVQAILVNIFGGIMKCDVVASGIVAAAKTLDLKVPLVVRLSGTNVEEGKKILSESGLKITTADNLDEAARRATESIGIVN
eukprot:TRINITY_DN8503_c0_g1_i1.p1 TRINITY_DN8503_c0_g1~~TRINITY_DN8503_c0_g1_i1.p1  ORF type:complete len:435 (+),score=133.11 TRINITY_DN8503_c0_g1_i1:33-1307(+)